MNYSKTSLSISQQPLFPDILLINMADRVRHWSDAKISILNALLLWATTYDKVGVSQGKLALIAGVTRQTVNKYVSELTEEGYLTKTFRKRMTCLYVVHPGFFYPPVRISLRHVFSALKNIPPLLLSVCHHARNFFKNTYKRTILTVVNNRIKRNNKFTIARRARSSFIDRFSRAMGGVKMISPEIESIDFLGKLTLDEKKRLSIFPDEAIIHGKTYARYAHKARNPFAWFISLCLDYCKTNGIKPEWSNRYAEIPAPKSKDPAKVKQETRIKSDNHARLPERTLYKPRREQFKVWTPDEHARVDSAIDDLMKKLSRIG